MLHSRCMTRDLITTGCDSLPFLLLLLNFLSSSASFPIPSSSPPVAMAALGPSTSKRSSQLAVHVAKATATAVVVGGATIAGAAGVATIVALKNLTSLVKSIHMAPELYKGALVRLAGSLERVEPIWSSFSPQLRHDHDKQLQELNDITDTARAIIERHKKLPRQMVQAVNEITDKATACTERHEVPSQHLMLRASLRQPEPQAESVLTSLSEQAYMLAGDDERVKSLQARVESILLELNLGIVVTMNKRHDAYHADLKHDIGQVQHRLAGRAEPTAASTQPLHVRLGGWHNIITVSQFTIDHAKPLGRGRYGEVLVGEMRRNGKTVVAIKRPLPTPLDATQRAQWEREVEQLYRLREEINVVQMLAVCIEPGHETIVMPLMEGGDLFHRLEQARQGKRELLWTWEHKLQLAIDIVRGVNALHLLSPPLGPIMHRDIKSLNVLLSGDEQRAAISDLGASRLVHIPQQSGAFESITADKPVGTLKWLCPEQHMFGQKWLYNAKCDVYSLGVVLWELATGDEPWLNVDPATVVERVQAKDRPESASWASVPPRFKQWIERCWHHDSFMRPTCDALLAEMQDWQRQGKPSLHPSRLSLSPAPLHSNISHSSASAFSASFALASSPPASQGSAACTTSSASTDSSSPEPDVSFYHRVRDSHLGRPVKPFSSPMSSTSHPSIPLPSTLHQKSVSAGPSTKLYGLLPERCRSGQSVCFDGVFHESPPCASLSFKLKIHFLDSPSAKGNLLDGNGRDETNAIFRLPDSWYEIDTKTSEWKLRLHLHFEWRKGTRPMRQARVSAQGRDKLTMEGKWLVKPHTADLTGSLALASAGPERGEVVAVDQLTYQLTMTEDQHLVKNRDINQHSSVR